MKTPIGGSIPHDSMCTVCIQAKHKGRLIRVPVKCTTKHFELVNSDVCCPISTPTFGANRYYIPFIHDYTRYTSVWQLPNKTAEPCTSALKSFQAQVNSLWYKFEQFWWDHGRWEYDHKTFWSDLMVRGTAYEPWPLYAQHENGVAERMICTINEKAWEMMSYAHAPFQFWGEAVNTTDFLHQRSLNEGLKTMTMIAIEHCTKCHMRWSMDLVNWHTMVTTNVISSRASL